jgi:hypothetical protein
MAGCATTRRGQPLKVRHLRLCTSAGRQGIASTEREPWLAIAHSSAQTNTRRCPRSLSSLEIGLRCLQGGMALIAGSGCIFQRFLRRNLLCHQALHAQEIVLRLRNCSLSLGNLRFRPRHGRLVAARINAKQDFALLHHGTVGIFPLEKNAADLRPNLDDAEPRNSSGILQRQGYVARPNVITPTSTGKRACCSGIRSMADANYK